MNNRKVKGYRLAVRGVLSVLCMLYSVFFVSCDPNAKWSADNVEVTVRIENASTGFAVCEFTTTQEAYYLIAIEEARPGYNPMEHQKSFMSAALDSAYAAYLDWRNELWRKDEFNVAPFSSHSLQYGNGYYTFTGLKPNSKYWIYAFIVNPSTMQPAGQLAIDSIETILYSDIHMQYEYRIKGSWDYIYPMDDYGYIDNVYPYVAVTCDSLDVEKAGQTPVEYFKAWYANLDEHPEQADIIYGVKAVNHNGYSSREEFEEGHTYYTTIACFDGPYGQMLTYKFTWTGEDHEEYLREVDVFLMSEYNVLP